MRDELCRKGTEVQAMRRLLGKSCSNLAKNTELSLPRVKAANGIRSFAADGKVSFNDFILESNEQGRIGWKANSKKDRGMWGNGAFLHPLVDMEQVQLAVQDITDHYYDHKMLHSMHVYVMESVKVYGMFKTRMYRSY